MPKAGRCNGQWSMGRETAKENDGNLLPEDFTLYLGCR